jgi:NAD(P)-dependent dehydrogenase (short-subunit alcohol dehydrogenase family)
VRSTTDQVLAGADLRGTTALVTGASSGLGLETARALLAAGSRVICAVPECERERTADAIDRAGCHGDYEVMTLDLSSLASVRVFASGLLGRCKRLAILVNNAGVFYPRLEWTGDGFETNLAVNYLGHFLLTKLLTPSLVAAGSARIVNLASRAHRESDFRWIDPLFEVTPFAVQPAYAQSKTAMMLFTVELERRLGDSGVHAYAVNPGAVTTGLTRHISPAQREQFLAATPYGEEVGVEVGAATIVFAATAKDLAGIGGVYLSDCRIVGEDGYASYALDNVAATRLWEWSEEQVTEQTRRRRQPSSSADAQGGDYETRRVSL